MLVGVQVYNPYLEHAVARRSARMTDFKVYNVDGAAVSDTALSGGGTGSAADVVVARAGSTRSGTRGHNDRFYDELDYERKLRKRKVRLMVAAEEAFNHVTRLHNDKGLYQSLGGWLSSVLFLANLDNGLAYPVGYVYMLVCLCDVSVVLLRA